MKKMMTIGMALVLTFALAGSTLASSIAAKVWYAEMEEIDDSTLMYGGTVSLSLGETAWLSGMVLLGTYDDVWGSGVDYDSADAEIVFGLSFGILDVGIGARYSLWTLSDAWGNEEELTIFGPMAYIGAGDLIGDSPIGWYIGASYMFKDFGDADDYDWVDGFEHYNIEGGLYLALDPLMATVGYRIKEYVEYDDSVFKGVTASIGFGF